MLLKTNSDKAFNQSSNGKGKSRSRKLIVEEFRLVLFAFWKHIVQYFLFVCGF